ncbi:MAG: LptF/LptG family permease [Pirellulales bacterium]|nr:LptF/LptG family permease [Pirellulales bacterium]
MKILDRYLLRQFAQIFTICFLSLMGLYVVIDAFGHLDSFSKHAEANGNLFLVIGEYYAYQSLNFLDRTGGILVMIAAVFTVIWLQRHQEMTAMLAAGISKLRVVRPLLIAALFFSFLGVANRELVIPHLRNELNRDTNDLAGTEPRAVEARFDKNGILVDGEKIVVPEQRIINPMFVLPNKLARYGKQLAAETAYYLEATSEHPAGYLLDQVSAPTKIDQRHSFSIQDQPIVMTSREASWLKPGQAFVVSAMPFQLLANGSSWHNLASTRELVAELQSPSSDVDAKLRVAVHARITRPVMDATLLMLGLPLMFSRRQRNVFLSIGICLLVAMAFSLVTLACQSLGGLSLLRPTLAAWLPIMVFLPLAVAISHTLRT